MMRRFVTDLRMALLAVILSAPLAGPLAAQAEELGSQTLGRAYWHVFLAYAIAWILIFGWIIAIARRLARVERRLQERDD